MKNLTCPFCGSEVYSFYEGSSTWLFSCKATMQCGANVSFNVNHSTNEPEKARELFCTRVNTNNTNMITQNDLIRLKHEQMVTKLLKDPNDILKSLDPYKVNLIHLALGISGEAGEILDNIKKNAIYNKPLDVENLVEELGDLLFYIEGLRQHLCIPLETILERNIVKLNKRYEKGYSDASAIERKDKE